MSGDHQAAPRPLVRAEEIARACSVSSRHIHNLATRGVIPSIRLGEKCIRFAADAVEEALGLPAGIIQPQDKVKTFGTVPGRLRR